MVATTATIAQQIHAAYLALSVKPQDWVYLSKIRPLVDGDYDQQEAALLALVRTGEAALASDHATRFHTDEVRAAASHLGGDPSHWIGFNIEFVPDFDEDGAVRTAQQQDRITRARCEAHAAGGILSARATGDGYVVVAEIYGTEITWSALDPDGNITN